MHSVTLLEGLVLSEYLRCAQRDPPKVLSNPNGGASLPAECVGHTGMVSLTPAVSRVSDVLMNTHQFSGSALASEGDELFSGAA